MVSDTPSRRALIRGGLVLAATRSLTPQTPVVLTAEQVIERIRQNVGVPWRTQTVDNIVLGYGATRVKGIATTMMATFEVVKRCISAERNLIISHETPVYMHQDDTLPLAKDPTYLAKKEFIERNQAVVFHFHDHWHARRPDGIGAGMARELGWEKNADPTNPRTYTFPGTPLAEFAKNIQKRLNIRTMRVVGDPKMPVKKVTTSWGYMSAVATVARPEVELFVLGETREWEVVEYIQDCIAAGQKKALIILGHVVSEQAGMRYCAEWLKSLVTEVPVEFIAAPEPFWSPDNPAG
jgi:putative NIF3 family GTP cyclohydrolase 1 type 2